MDALVMVRRLFEIELQMHNRALNGRRQRPSQGWTEVDQPVNGRTHLRCSGNAVPATQCNPPRKRGQIAIRLVEVDNWGPQQKSDILFDSINVQFI